MTQLLSFIGQTSQNFMDIVMCKLWLKLLLTTCEANSGGLEKIVCQQAQSSGTRLELIYTKNLRTLPQNLFDFS